MTIAGNGGNDTITLDYTNGNPLPATLHLNGIFTINGFQGTNPLAGTALDIEKSTVFISYSTADPLAAIQGYLQNGYNAGAWHGTPTRWHVSCLPLISDFGPIYAGGNSRILLSGDVLG